MIKKLVKEQILSMAPTLKKAIQESLEKEIKYIISEELNNKLLSVLTESRKPNSRLNIAMTSDDDDEMLSESRYRADKSEQIERLKKEIIGESSAMSFVYEDIGLTNDSSPGRFPPGVLPPPSQLTADGIVDSDDEGVNLESFDVFKNRKSKR